MAIERFRNEYYFLSSMCPVRHGVELKEGISGPTLEHPYQASKFEDPEAQAEILKADDGITAKDVAARLKESGAPVREDWEEVKLDIMRDLVAKKFTAGSRLAYLLDRTGEEELIEGNTWDDTFWGVCPPGSTNGENWLGRILMETRQSLREQNQKK